MRRRHPLPRRWLLTDPRQGEALWPALAAMRRGDGVIFRHAEAPDRRALFGRVRAIARARGLVLLLAGSPALARAWRADGSYGANRRRGALRAMPAHDARALVAARRAGADLVLLSPVFATRSHPGGQVLGRVRFAMLARGAGRPVVALGGMSAARMRGLPAHGWAAIDAWIGPKPDQNLKAVPR